MAINDAERARERTIADFGDQWTQFRDNSGYYASPELLKDVLSPLIEPDELHGLSVGDIGSGTGRIVRMLVAAGAEKVHAFEPSEAFQVLCSNVADLGERIECHQVRGDQIPPGLQLDVIVSIGVVHHIPDPGPVVVAALNALRPGGRLFLWLYGAEGNEWYLQLVRPLRWVTTRLPHRVLVALCKPLNFLLGIYIGLAKIFPMPLRRYLIDVFSHLSRSAQELVIYDQLNPAFAKYYRRNEVIDLMTHAGFEKIGLHHRHGYSWSVIGTRPAA
jgi:SAM-dependent methyltransferase